MSVESCSVENIVGARWRWHWNATFLFQHLIEALNISIGSGFLFWRHPDLCLESDHPIACFKEFCFGGPNVHATFEAGHPMSTAHPGRIATIARFPIRSPAKEIEDTGFSCCGGSWINQAIDDTIQFIRFLERPGKLHGIRSSITGDTSVVRVTQIVRDVI